MQIHRQMHKCVHSPTSYLCDLVLGVFQYGCLACLGLLTLLSEGLEDDGQQPVVILSLLTVTWVCVGAG